MATIDFHQHLWPEPLVEALRNRPAPPRIVDSRLELVSGSFPFESDAHVLANRLAELDRDGIDTAVVCLQPTLAVPLPQELVEAYHEGILRIRDEADGRIVALAAGAALDGFAGACVPAPALLDLDRLAPLLDELLERGQLLFIHPGPEAGTRSDPAWWAAGVDYVGQMQVAYAGWLADGASRWPGLPVVFAILAGGAPIQLERLAGRGLDVRSVLEADVYFDTASYGSRALELCLATYGVGRIVYGSDVPVIDPRPTLRQVRRFGAAVTAALCEDNPSRLLA
ncbi:MAG: amidohydrolase [Actinobacteria bacterium]|nr:MAG: amidohydrolase [Actinomycetota bacterium]